MDADSGADAGNSASATPETGSETGSQQSPDTNKNDDNSSNGSDDDKGEKSFSPKEVRAMIGAQATKHLDDFKTNDLPKILADARSKWEAEAKMSPEEREQTQKQEQESALAKREAQLDHREAVDYTRSKLISAGLPTDFVESLAVDKDTDATDKNVEAFTKTFSAAVQKKVAERMKGKSTPGVGAGSQHTTSTDLGQLLAKQHASDTRSSKAEDYFFGGKNK
ncbi:hypothetical protein L248_2145 [Schleiferilactobacillus shenzhenensis LY-73]|uniref:Scaffolding protein n=2 Tax=Schleiferilactobacillus shenzhenensis TaxID=1231337 RepID=U4TQT5_9LACO|nr:hypothetical protein L248_2145 [Schleiferilactobacillus shenzhenensis LY-73]